jgi:hypothetical protein
LTTTTTTTMYTYESLLEGVDEEVKEAVYDEIYQKQLDARKAVLLEINRLISRDIVTDVETIDRLVKDQLRIIYKIESELDKEEEEEEEE